MREEFVELADQWGRHRLRVLHYGPKNAARQIVCVHGLTRNAFDFAYLSEALATVGYSVIVPEMVGRGGSSWLDAPAGYTVETYAQHMLALLDHYALEQVDWIGTSMGGLIALEMAKADRFRSLILNDIGPFVPQQALVMIAAYLAYDQVFDDLAALEAHLRLIHAPFGPLSDAQWAHLAEHSARSVEGQVSLLYDPEIRVNFKAAATGDIDVWPLWAQVSCPTLLVRGSESTLFDKATLQRMKEHPADVRAVEIEGVGHAPALMDRHQIDLVQDFLATV